MTRDCIIVDDELTARNILKKYIENISSLNLIAEFKNAIEALNYIQNNNVDIVFLDIEMPKLSGINLARIIEDKTKIIFTTAHREFALEGFEVSAVDYLLKPISFDRFYKATKKIESKNNEPNDTVANNYIYVKANKRMIKVDFTELLYIEGLSNYVKIFTVSGVLVVYDKMSSILTRLPRTSFMRIHKSYIVNINLIEVYTREYVEIKNKHLPISDTYRQTFLSFLKK